MEFPDDILAEICEFSKPLTNGDWRLGSYLRREGLVIPPQNTIDDNMAYEYINWEIDMHAGELYYRTFICTTQNGFRCRWVYNTFPFPYGYMNH